MILFAKIVENFKVKLSTAEEWKENNEKIYMNQEEEIIEQENDYDMKTPGIILEKKMTDPLIDNNIASNDLPQNVITL